VSIGTPYRVGYASQSATRVEVDGWSAGAPGDLDNNGVIWTMAPLDGWHEAPNPRLTMQPRPSEHGAFDGNGFNDPRVITIPGTAIAPDLATAKQARDAVASVAGDPKLGLTVLTVYVEGNPTMQAEVRRSAPTKTSAIGSSCGFAFSMILTAPDPRRYSAALKTPSVGLASPGAGGLVFPLTFPLVFGAGASGGQLDLDHQGTTATWPTWRILGPCTGPSITDLTTGARLVFDPTFSVPAGVECVVDTDLKTVLMQGVSYRSSLFTAEWFEIQPGGTTVRFAATSSFDPAALLTAEYREAWT